MSQVICSDVLVYYLRNSVIAEDIAKQNRKTATNVKP